MAGHGGHRAGAGAPRGGVSETRRLLLAAIESGVELAGRSKGLKGTRSEVIEQTGANMVCDLILAGDVKNVLAIWGQSTGKDSASSPATDNKSGLANALNQASKMLSGQSNGTESVQKIPAPHTEQGTATHQEESTMDTESNAPTLRGKNEMMFIPQQALPLELPAAEEPPKGEGAAPTHPQSDIHYRVEPETLEKNFENSGSEE